MKKKIMLIGFLAIIMLLTITFTTAIGTNTTSEQKESPLYKIRTRQKINEKINEVLKQIKTKFLGERIFLLPGTWFNYILDHNSYFTEKAPTECYVTCNGLICP